MRPANHFEQAIILLIVLFFSACRNNSSTEEITETDSNIVKSAVSNKDTLISEPCALLIYPTLKQIDELRESSGNDSIGFYTAADDNQYYMWMSKTFLDSVKTKTFAKNATGSATFKANTGRLFKLGLDSLQWSIVLFNGTDEPKNADITMIDEDDRSYMKK